MSGLVLKKLITNVPIVASHLQANSSIIKIYQCFSTSTFNSDVHKSLIKKEMVVDYLRSEKIKYCQGWNTFNLYMCPKADDLFHLNKNTGNLNSFEFYHCHRIHKN